MRLEKENRLVSLHEDTRKEEEMTAFTEAKKRSQKQREQEAQKDKLEKYEMERALTEMKQRNKEMQFVKDHELEFEKQVEATHRAKMRDEAAKGKRWEDERIHEDLEMELAIKTRHDLQQQKLLDVGKARDKADAKARCIEAATIEASKALQGKNIENIALDEFLEEEQRKKKERIRRNELIVQKKEETDKVRLDLEVDALTVEKEKRAQTFELQEAELNRFEEEVKIGNDIRARKEAEKRQILEKQIEDEERRTVIFLERQKMREQEKETKKDEIARDTETFDAMQADNRKTLQNNKKEVEELVKLHDESLKQEEDLKRTFEKKRIEKEKQQREEETEKHEAELWKLVEAQKQSKQEYSEYGDREESEERLRLEGLKRRQLQQQQIANQQDAELEMLMKSRANPPNVEGNGDTTQVKKKGLFSSLFGRRCPKE
ncbi:hypothetical protein QZH41_001036 [Actinostola sp. cb2023]|nr:hypothetical protein QZH41_001036 [Actinostola sp. cb2023]